METILDEIKNGQILKKDRGDIEQEQTAIRPKSKLSVT